MSFTAEQFGYNKEVNQYAVGSVIPFPYGVGIEVELEFGEQIPKPIVNGDRLQYWTMVGDGSLKHGMEYVTVSPLISGSVVNALVELNASLKEQSITPTLSERTSVHIHIDARDMSKQQISNFILLYLVFEKVLFQYCGEDRAKNVFCLSAMDSEGIVKALAQFFNSKGGRAADMLHGYQRYSSLNLNSLAKFGSIEIRAHRGEYKVRQLTNWINILLSIKHFVTQNDEIWDTLPDHVSTLGPVKFMESVFGKYSKHINYHGCEADIIDGVRVAQNVLFSGNFSSVEKAMRKKDTLGIESPLFLQYMERKYPAVYKENIDIKGIKKTVIGNEKTYSINLDEMSVTTKAGNIHNLHRDEDGWFFVNKSKTKVYLSNAYQDYLNNEDRRRVEREAIADVPPAPRVRREARMAGLRGNNEWAVNPIAYDEMVNIGGGE